MSHQLLLKFSGVRFLSSSEFPLANMISQLFFFHYGFFFFGASTELSSVMERFNRCTDQLDLFGPF